jgi:hypothetical protein
MNRSTTKKITRTKLEASRDINLEINAEKSKYFFLFVCCPQTIGIY